MSRSMSAMDGTDTGIQPVNGTRKNCVRQVRFILWVNGGLLWVNSALGGEPRPTG